MTPFGLRGRSTIWLATHSNTEASEAGLAAGLIDTPLSVTGRRQALELRDRYGTPSGIHIAVEERAWRPGWCYEYRGSGGAA